MKKEGSILIEGLSAAAIVMISSAFICRSYIDDVMYLKQRIYNEKAEETADNIAKEFKYNLSFAEIDNLLKNDEVCFKYDENLSCNLIYSNVKDLERGNGIRVEKLNEDDHGTKYEVEVSIKYDGNKEACVKKDFIKSWWMDEA